MVFGNQGLTYPKAPFLIVTAIGVVTAILAAAGFSFGLTLDRVVATVDGEVVTLSDYQWFAKSEEGEVKADVIDEVVFKKMIDEKVIAHEAARRGMEITDDEVDKMVEDIKQKNKFTESEFERELLREGIGIRRYRQFMKERVVASRLVGEDVDGKVVVTDKEIWEVYNAKKMSYMTSPGEVEMKAIFFKLNGGATVTEITDLKRKTLRIAAELQQGGDIEKFLNLYSDGNKNDYEKTLGVFKRGTLVPALDKKAFAMEKGQTSDPIWVKGGVYILKLINKSDMKFKTMEEVRDEIYLTVFKEKRKKLFHDWVRELWEKSSITIN